jgi:hypothetical protein
MKAELAIMSTRMKQYWVDKKLRQAEQQSALKILARELVRDETILKS